MPLNRDKKIIVTGAAGFIGSNIVRALNAQSINNLILTDNLDHPGKESNLKSLAYEQYLDSADFLSNLASLPSSEIGAVIHLGACTDTLVRDEEYMMHNNFEYSKKLWEFCVQNNLRFIYASSAAVYGDGSRGFKEDAKDLKPLNLYGRSKALFDEFVLSAREKPPQWVGLRFFNVYGPGEAHKEHMASMIYKSYLEIKKTGRIELFASSHPDFADGEEKRDFIFVGDVVKIILYFFEHADRSGIFNVGTGKARSFRALADALFAALNLKPQIEFVPMPEAIRGNYQYFTEADLTKLRAAGFAESFTGLEDGIKQYVEKLESI